MKNKLIYFSLITTLLIAMSGCAADNSGDEADNKLVLRVANCEEYIDLGEWDEDEVLELEDGTCIFGENALYDDFAQWYEDTYGIEVEVEYSTYGTNEDLYNQITIGDVYDLVCPSEYMIMKMMREGMLEPFSDDFYDEENENNYYAKGLSPYIRNVFNELEMNGESVSKYAGGYMWGTLGMVYNPEYVSEEEAAHWNLLLNDKFYKRLSIKDSVRDAYFAAIAINYYDDIMADDFVNAPDYHERLSEILNRTDEETVNGVQDILTKIKNNVYSFETDSGKADMVTGKVVANEQWSGDAVYTMDQAEEDGVELCYATPEEGANLWFDGWVMLKSGLAEDSRKQHAAEAFINYLSMPENVVRNMYYIGYTSTITGGDSPIIFDYINYCYGAEEDDEDTAVYDDIGYLFDEDSDEANDEYSILTTEDQLCRQLFAQYPPKSVVDKSVIMKCFEEDGNIRVNRSWINVRCFDLKSLFD